MLRVVPGRVEGRGSEATESLRGELEPRSKLDLLPGPIDPHDELTDRCLATAGGHPEANIGTREHNRGHRTRGNGLLVSLGARQKPNNDNTAC